MSYGATCMFSTKLCNAHLTRRQYSSIASSKIVSFKVWDFAKLQNIHNVYCIYKTIRRISAQTRLVVYSHCYRNSCWNKYLSWPDFFKHTLVAGSKTLGQLRKSELLKFVSNFFGFLSLTLSRVCFFVSCWLLKIVDCYTHCTEYWARLLCI